MTRPGAANWIRRCCAGAVLIAVLVVGVTGFRVWQVARVDDRARADVIVVLGAAQYNGRPSETFESRLEHAKELYDEGVASDIVTSGGKQRGDTYTEADTGVKWLVENGVSTEHAIAVAQGSDTFGSLRAVGSIARDHGWGSAVIVSDPWHSLRATTMAEDAGLKAWSSPSHRGPFLPSQDTQRDYLRETGGLLYYRMTKASTESLGLANHH